MLSVTDQKTKDKSTIKFRKKFNMAFINYDITSLSLFTILMLFFSFFMFLPIFTISIKAFNLENPSDLFRHFLYCFESTKFRHSLFNSLFAGLITTIICSIIGITVTLIFSRYRFFGKKYFQVLTILPLVSPPFVGAFAISRLLARNGILSNFLRLFIPGLPEMITGSIWGLILIQSIHLWPLIYFNTASSYSKLDPAQEEQARNLGSWSTNLYRRIILPMITPGFMAGAVLVFIWSISDLGTPIVINFPDFAPFQAFVAIKYMFEPGYYIEAAYALVIILLVVSLAALIFASRIVGMRDYAPEKVSGMEQSRLMHPASKPKTVFIWALLVSLLVLSLLPHLGVFFVAFIRFLNSGEIIPSEWSLGGVGKVLFGETALSGDPTYFFSDAITLIFLIVEMLSMIAIAIIAVFVILMILYLLLLLLVNIVSYITNTFRKKELGYSYKSFSKIGIINTAIASVIVGFFVAMFSLAGTTVFVTMIINSLLYSSLAMIITIGIGIAVGYLLIRKKNLKGISIIMAVIGFYMGLILGVEVSEFYPALRVPVIIVVAFIVSIVFFVLGRMFNLKNLDLFSTMPFAVPGIVMAVGYLIFFSSLDSFWGVLPPELDTIPILGIITAGIREILHLAFPIMETTRFTSYWFILVISYSMRRMPYSVQASTAVLRQIHVSLEEQAYNLGASGLLTLRRITIPLMASGIFAGGILTFVTSFTEVSTSILIQPQNPPILPFVPMTSRSDPLTLGIYSEIQRGGDTMPAGVLGLIQLLVATIGMVITQRSLGEKTGTAFGG
ncbi:MAG: ABC transporter permease [Candidatus Odinarchaeota archaeon]